MGLDIYIYEIDEESEKIFTDYTNYEGGKPFPKHFNAFEEEEDFLNIEKMCTDRGGIWSGHTVADPEFGDPEKGMLLFVKNEETNKSTKHLIPDKELEEKYTFKAKIWKVKVNPEELGFWQMGYGGLERWKDRKTPFDEDVDIKRYHFEEETLDEIEEMVLDERKLTWLKEFRIKFKELLSEGKRVFVSVSG